MKTFIFNLADRWRQYSQELDVQEVLCAQSWCVFDNDESQEVLIFKRDGCLIISVNGDTQSYKWQYFTQNNSLLINHTDLKGTLLKPAFVNEKILIFRKDGTNEYMFLMNEQSRDINETPLSLDAVKQMLDEIINKQVLSEPGQKQSQEKVDLIEMKSRIIAFESQRKRFFTKLMQSDSYKDDIHVNTNIINRNRLQEQKFDCRRTRCELVAAILYFTFIIVLIGWAAIVVIQGYKYYQSLNVVGINLPIIFEYLDGKLIDFIFIFPPFGLAVLIVTLIESSKYRQEPLVSNNTILELQKFIEKNQDLYSYMHITLEDEIIDAEQNSQKILDKINDIDNQVKKYSPL